MEKKENIKTEKIVFKNHPIVMFRFTAVVALFFINELLRSARDILSNKESIYEMVSKFNINAVIVVIPVLFILLIFLILRGFLIYKNSEIIVGEKSIYYKMYGVFFKKEKESLLTHITNVNLNSGIFYKILGVKNVLIDINSSETADEHDYKIVLDKKEAEKLRNIILDRKEIQLEKEEVLKKDVRERNNKRSIDGIQVEKVKNMSLNEQDVEDINVENIDFKNEKNEEVISIGKEKKEKENKESEKITLNQSKVRGYEENENNTLKNTDFEKIKKEAISVRDLNRDKYFIKKFTKSETIKSTIFEAGISSIFEIIVVFTLIAILKKIIILIFIFQPIKNIFKSYNKVSGFSIERVGSHIKVHYGFIDKKDFDIDVENIIGIGTHQTLLSRIMKSSCVTIDQIGYGNNDGELNWGSLFMKDCEIEGYVESLIPEMSIRHEKSTIINKEEKNIKVIVSEEDKNEKTEIYEEKEDSYLKRPGKIMYYLIFKSIVIIEIIGGLLHIYFKTSSIFLIGMAISFLIGAFIFYNKKVLIKSDGILFCEGIFSKDKKIVPYKKIESIVYKQSIVQKKMRVASLKIYYRDYKHGKTSESTGLFEEDSFNSIIEYYENGEL